jgi:oligosaccharide repeat unit polymerase
MKHQSIWWLHPAWTVCGFTGLIVVVAHVLSAQAYFQNWNTPKYLNEDSFALSLLCLALFAAGSFLAGLKPRGWRPQPAGTESPVALETVRRLFYLSYFLTIFGYAVWAGLAVSRGLNVDVIMAVLKGETGAAYNIRGQYLQNISGVTTCTQFGISTAILAVLVSSQLSKRRRLILFVPLAFVTIARALLNTERLAMVEVAVPAGVLLVYGLVNRDQVTKRLRILLSILPIAGFGLLFFVFSSFEYFRSWVTFYADNSNSFWEFAAARLLGYYVTALNNGACLIKYLALPFGVPVFTLNLLWKFPVLKGLIESVMPAHLSADDYFGILGRAANPEFNNAGGLMAPFLDFGLYAGLLYWFLAGVACGFLYRLFRRGNAWGLCLYPFVYIGLLEIPRGLYWADGRSFPAFGFLVLSAFVLRIQQARRPLSQPKLAARPADAPIAAVSAH